jgi:activating signal cointegrator complex subunit 3
MQLALVDNLNAEIVLGTVTNVKEAQAWLGYSYLNVRLAKSPLAYGLTYDQVITDPGLEVSLQGHPLH